MQLGFPQERREVQQSREYNVAKVRGGYYLSHKQGDAPLDEVIRSKMADITQDGCESSEHQDVEEGSGLGQGMSDQDFKIFSSTQGVPEDVPDNVPASKYMPSLQAEDPIISEIYRLGLASHVKSFVLLDSRWNGNEVLQYITDKGSLFVKMNRCEDSSVFIAEAAGLTSILRTKTVVVPKPLHVGKLPKVGAFGPGAFLITEYLKLEPFGALKSSNQKILGEQLARLHKSDVLKDVHKGRFGFVVNNLHALLPQDNSWKDSWTDFFYSRMRAQVNAAYKSSVWGRASLPQEGTQSLSLLAVLVQKYKY